MTTDELQIDRYHHRPGDRVGDLAGGLAGDLARNVAGSAARAKRHLLPVDRPTLRERLAHLLHGTPDVGNWRVDLVGEHKVDQELQLLGPNWRVLHAVPVDERGAGIDHLLIGPAGVLSVHTKRRPGSSVLVTHRSVCVDNRRTDHLHACRRDGTRASEVLTAACGFPVTVSPVVVFVDLRSFEVARQPTDVYVTTRKRLIPWLEWLPETMDAATADAVYAAARRSSTWTT
jgi:hypothetical protein